MNKITIAVAALTFIASASGASAATLTQTMNQSEPGDEFNFSFSTTEKPIGPGTLTFLIRGDFTLDDADEFFDYRLENVFAGANIRASGSNLITSYGFNDNLFSPSFSLSQSALNQLLADNVINLSVFYSADVNTGFTLAPFITATIDFASSPAAIPEPATWAMMLVGFGMIGATARYRRRSAKVTYA
jgi:hypothetical protein